MAVLEAMMKIFKTEVLENSGPVLVIWAGGVAHVEWRQSQKPFQKNMRASLKYVN